MRRLSIVIAILALLGASGGSIWYFAIRNDQKSPNSKPQTTQNQPQANSNTPQSSTAQNNQSSKSYPVLVYFSKHPDSDNDPSKTFPVNRTSTDLGVATFAIERLLTALPRLNQVKGTSPRLGFAEVRALTTSSFRSPMVPQPYNS